MLVLSLLGLNGLNKNNCLFLKVIKKKLTVSVLKQSP